MTTFEKAGLAISSWNIYGLFSNKDGNRYNKLATPELSSFASCHKLFGLVETHHVASDISELQIVGFKYFQVCRTKLSRGRESGGICVYVHESISRGVKKIPTAGSESILVKLDKSFFSLSRDIVISYTYCVPKGSSYQIRTQFDPFEDLENKLCNIKDTCDIISLGDFNARLGLKADYIPDEDNTSIPVFGQLCGTDTQAARPRASLDRITNSYGDRLIDMCKSIPLRICNGRKLGDFLGSYTCYKKHGQSAVDYCLVSPRIYNIISTFVINELYPDLSDHCSVTIKLQTKYFSQFCKKEHFELSTKPKRLKLDNIISVKFENNIQSEPSTKFLSDFLKRKLGTNFSLNQAMTDLSDFLVTSAEKTGCPINGSFPSHASAKKSSPL